MSAGHGSRIAPIIKRGFDLLLSGTLLLVLSPLLLAVAVAIKLTSHGSVFVLQARLGRGRREFPMVKFRTMHVREEERLAIFEALNNADGPVFKIKNDPRVTTLGRFLRKYDIDELPELFNVLIGDMSIVGPRPLPVLDAQAFGDDQNQKRFSLRPGVTGLWQVSGRSSASFDRVSELDLHYIENWSFWMDAQILAKTFSALFSGRGAA